MPQSNLELHITSQIKVNNEGSAEGWTPSLPAGQVDNDLFEPVANPAPTISTITRAAAIATVTTAGPHYMPSGTEVTISGADQAEYNGDFIITKTGEDTFEITVAGAPTTPATGTLAAVFSGDFIRVKTGAGYLRPRNYELQVRWDKVGQPISVNTHILDTGDTGCTQINGFQKPLKMVANTLPTIGPTTPFEFRWNAWANVAMSGSVFEFLRTTVGITNRIYATNNFFLFEQGAGQEVGVGGDPIIVNSWNEIKLIGTDPGGGYEVQLWVNDLLQLTVPGAFGWATNIDWHWFWDSGVDPQQWVISNIYMTVNGIIYVNEEVKTGPGVLSTAGGIATPTFNTRRGNA